MSNEIFTENREEGSVMATVKLARRSRSAPVLRSNIEIGQYYEAKDGRIYIMAYTRNDWGNKHIVDVASPDKTYGPPLDTILDDARLLKPGESFTVTV